MTDKVRKIREKVERLKSQLLRGACSSQIAMEIRCKEEAYNEMLAIIDSLQEEPVSNDLEEAASQYPSVIRTISPQWESELENAFKAGAKWQKKQIIQ